MHILPPGHKKYLCISSAIALFAFRRVRFDKIVAVSSRSFVHTTRKIEYGDISEVNGLPFALQSDKTSAQQLTILLYFGIIILYYATADLWFGILKHRVAINDVCNE